MVAERITAMGRLRGMVVVLIGQMEQLHGMAVTRIGIMGQRLGTGAAPITATDHLLDLAQTV